MDRICSACTYWTGDRKNGGQGECRRFPVQVGGVVPQQNALTGQVQPMAMSAWPICASTAWCGEFQSEMGLEITE